MERKDAFHRPLCGGRIIRLKRLGDEETLPLLRMCKTTNERNAHPMVAENTEKWTASRVLVIKYDRDGRYHERLFRRTVLNNAFPVYISPDGDRFEKNLLTTYPKAYPIPDDAKLYRWVLKDGTVVTTTNGFPQSDCKILSTFDEHYMFVPESNIAYVMQDVASMTGEDN